MWPDGQTRHFVILLSHATRHFYIFRDFLSPNVQRRDSAAYRFASRHNTMTHDIRYYRLWTRLLCNIPLMERKIQRILVLRLMSFYSVCFHRCSIIIWWNLRAAVYLCIIWKKNVFEIYRTRSAKALMAASSSRFNTFIRNIIPSCR